MPRRKKQSLEMKLRKKAERDGKRRKKRGAEFRPEKKHDICSNEPVRTKKERRSALTEEERAVRRKVEAERKRAIRSQLSEEERALIRERAAARQRDLRLARSSGLLPPPHRRPNRTTATKDNDVVTFVHNAEDVLRKNVQKELAREVASNANEDDTVESDLLQIKKFKTSVAAIKMATVELIKNSIKSAVCSWKNRKGVVTNRSNRRIEKPVVYGSKGYKRRIPDENSYQVTLPVPFNKDRKLCACIVCKETFKTLSRIRLHLPSHSAAELSEAKEKFAHIPPSSKMQNIVFTVYDCEICSEKSYSIVYYRNHVLEKHKDNKEVLSKICFPCTFCEEAFNLRFTLMTHLKRAHGIFTQCPICNENLKTQDLFGKHLDEKHFHCYRKEEDFFEYADGFFCKICGFCNRSYRDLCAHMKEGHSHMESLNSFECEICETKCETNDALFLHQQDAHGGKTLCCEQCGNHYKSIQSLNSHKRLMHNPNPSSKIRGKFVCEHCGKSFVKKESYREHNLAIHQGKNAFQCKTCGESFSYYTVLHQHKITVCGKDKAIAKTCPICGKVLANYILLSQHKMNIHKYGNIEENACHLCNKTFKNPLVLYTHNNTIHSKKEPLVCAVCKEKSYPNKKKLLDHWTKHREYRSVKCNSCEKTYKTKRDFYGHRRKTHGNAKEEVKYIIDSEIFSKMMADFNAAHASEFLKHSKKDTTSDSILLETPTACQDDTMTKHSNALDDVFAEEDFDCILADVLAGNEGVPSGSSKMSLHAAETNKARKKYDYFSTANVPEISQTVIEKPPANFEPTVVSKSTDQKRLPKLPTPPETNESEDDFMEDFFDFSGIMEPKPLSSMDCSENGLSLATEDKKPFIYRSDMKDPFKKWLVVELERLRSCTLCNDVFPTLNLYREHMDSKGHRAVKRAHKKADILVPKTESRETIYDEEKLKQLKESGMKLSSCKICSKNFTRMRYLVNHYISAHEGKHIIKCEICDMGFPDYNLRLLRVHMTIRHQSEKLHSCDLCGERNSDLNLFDTHMKCHNNDKRKCVHCLEEFRQIEMEGHYNETHNGNMPFVCRDCPQKFFLQYRFELHEEDHRQKKKEELKERRKHYKKRVNGIFPCPFCDKTFTKMSHYTLHSKEHKKKDNVCLLCSEKFSTIRKLANHYISEHDGQNIVRCEVCGEGFLDYAEQHLRRHMTGKHVLKPRDKPRVRKTLKTLYTCDICGEKIRGMKFYRAHLLTHGEEKHKCVMCDTETDGLNKLEMHYKDIHNGDMPFPCENCSQKFPLKSRLELHMKKDHSQPRQPYQNLSSKYSPAMCDVCGKVIAREYDLPKHKATHMPEETRHKFFCEFCGKSFLHEYTLTMHFRTHTGEKPYPCTICGGDVAFTMLDILNTHLRRVHNSFTCDICGESFERETKLAQHRKTHKSDT